MKRAHQSLGHFKPQINEWLRHLNEDSYYKNLNMPRINYCVVISILVEIEISFFCKESLDF